MGDKALDDGVGVGVGDGDEVGGKVLGDGVGDKALDVGVGDGVDVGVGVGDTVVALETILVNKYIISPIMITAKITIIIFLCSI